MGKEATSKGEETRNRIIEEAAGLFNRHGRAGTSISDVMAATGLQKGGIYRHFDSKEDLAIEAFELAKDRMARRYAGAVAGERTALDRLRAIVDVAIRVPTDPPVPGGCPLLSAAVESDHGDPALRGPVRRALTGLHGMVERIVRRGIEASELRSSADPKQVATAFVACLEGGMMLAQVFEDPAYTARVRSHLLRYVERELAV